MNGNIMLQTRGSLVNLLNNRALGYGEIFIATKQETTSLTEKVIYDISGVTNPSDGAGTRITRIDPGDIFAGYNSQTQVYALGSSGALRWGGLSTATSYSAAKDLAAGNPNYIYMYVGNTDLKDQTTEIKEKYVASASSEFNDIINPGDLFFYSPKLNQTVVLHLNHSTDALTKINVSALVSSSMRTFLGATGMAGTLKDFLDGPARHYQYLDGTYGWTPITDSLDGVTIEKNNGVVKINQGLERCFALGTGALVVSVQNMKIDETLNTIDVTEATTKIQFVGAKKIYPLSWEDNEIKECAFVTYKTIKGINYVFIAMHIINEQGNYEIQNYKFKVENGKCSTRGD